MRFNKRGEIMETSFTNQQLFSYAYLSVSFNARQDIFKNYVNLVEYYLAERHFKGNNIRFEILHEGINSFYGIQMPKATLQKLLQIMQKQGKVKLGGQEINISPVNFNTDYLEHKEKIENDVQVLIIDFKRFLNEKEVFLGEKEAKELFFKFIQSNSFIVAEIFTNQNTTINEKIEHSPKIIEFLKYTKQTNKNEYETILHLAMGAIRTSLLNLNPDKIMSLGSNKIILEKVILDTNYLLRLLNLQGKLDCQIAKETFEMLKKMNVTFIVHEKTVNEMLSSISHYLFQTETITPTTKKILHSNNIEVSGFLAAEENGITRNDLLKYRDQTFTTFEIEKLGCKLVNDTVIINDNEIETLVNEKNRDSYTKENAEHDLTLIGYCSLLRKNKKKPINNEKIWVLTNDVKLTEWHKQKCRNYGHACITESQLASYIWMQTGNTGIELNYAILALSSQNTLGIEQIINFQQAYIEFAQTESVANLQQLALVFACGEVSKDDILDAHDNESMVNLISRKIVNIEQEGKEKDSIIQENTKLLESLKAENESVKNERKKLIEENFNLNKKKLNLQTENERFIKEINFLSKSKKELIKTNRLILTSLIPICGLLFFVAKIILSTFIEKKQQGEFIQTWLPIIISIGIPFAATAIMTFIMGEPCNYKEFLKCLTIKFSAKKIKTYLKDADLSCEVNLNEISNMINERQKLLDNNCRELYDIDIENGKIEYAIRRIDNLSI